MNSDGFPSALYTLRDATRPELDWSELYRSALATGHGECIAPDEERIAATDELLGHILSELVVLGELAGLASMPTLATLCRRPLERTVAGIVRVLDRALAAHGRDHGYLIDRWREGAVTMAAMAANDLRHGREGERWPLPLALERGTRAISKALVALPRDRIAVPGHLADAVSELLVVYAAAAE